MANNAIRIQQAPMEVTFKYGNVTRNSSKRGGDDYFVFDCEEGRINADAALGEAIASNWPGRGGSAKIWKTENGYDVEITDPAERIWDLEMRQWDDSSNSFVECDMNFGNGAVKKPDSSKEIDTKQSGGKPVTRSSTSISDAQDVMQACINAAMEIVPDTLTEQQQKVAVTLFMQFKNKSLSDITEVEEQEPVEQEPLDEPLDEDDRPF